MAEVRARAMLSNWDLEQKSWLQQRGQARSPRHGMARQFSRTVGMGRSHKPEGAAAAGLGRAPIIIGRA